MSRKHRFLIVPFRRRMAFLAGILRKLPAVNVEMAVAAVGSRFGEHQIRMAGNTIEGHVPSDQREARFLVIKGEIGAQRTPAFSSMAGIAGDGELTMRTFVLHRGPTACAHDEYRRKQTKAVSFEVMQQGTHVSPHVSALCRMTVAAFHFQGTINHVRYVFSRHAR